MANNFHVANPTKNNECNVTSYFAYYAIGALLKHGKVRESLAFMRKYWGHMLEQGAWTCWEYFVGRQDSLCHAWSAAPTHYLSTLLLGVSFPEPGNPMVVRIAPQTGRPGVGRGRLSAPAGADPRPLAQGGREMDLEVQAPAGVQVDRG